MAKTEQWKLDAIRQMILDGRKGWEIRRELEVSSDTISKVRKEMGLYDSSKPLGQKAAHNTSRFPNDFAVRWVEAVNRIREACGWELLPEREEELPEELLEGWNDVTSQLRAQLFRQRMRSA